MLDMCDICISQYVKPNLRLMNQWIFQVWLKSFFFFVQQNSVWISESFWLQQRFAPLLFTSGILNHNGLNFETVVSVC